MMDKLATFDKNLVAATFSTSSSSTVVSTYSYDTLAADANFPNAMTSPASSGPAGFGGVVGRPIIHDVGRGRPVFLNVQIGTTCVGATATLEVDFISSAAATLGTPTVVLKSPAVAVASLVAGYMYPFKTLPRKVSQQYIGVQYITGTAQITAGDISAWLSLDSGGDNADVIGGSP